MTWRKINAALAAAWAICVPVSLVTGWVYSLLFVSLASIYANFATHVAGWRADVPTDKNAESTPTRRRSLSELLGIDRCDECGEAPCENRSPRAVEKPLQTGEKVEAAGIEPACQSRRESPNSRDFSARVEFADHGALEVEGRFVFLKSDFHYSSHGVTLEEAIPKLEFILRAAKLAQEV